MQNANFFSNLPPVPITEEQLRQQFPNASQGFIRANMAFAETHAGLAPKVTITDETPTKMRIRQSSKPLMNKLETEFHDLLRKKYPNVNIRAQAKRWRLGNGIWYKPDLSAMVDGAEIVWEVKGPHSFRGGFENLKVAASLYPETEWFLAWKDDNDRWQTQLIFP